MNLIKRNGGGGINKQKALNPLFFLLCFVLLFCFVLFCFTWFQNKNCVPNGLANLMVKDNMMIL